jgi:hypothetical protein
MIEAVRARDNTQPGLRGGGKFQKIGNVNELSTGNRHLQRQDIIQRNASGFLAQFADVS